MKYCCRCSLSHGNIIYTIHEYIYIVCRLVTLLNIYVLYFTWATDCFCLRNPSLKKTLRSKMIVFLYVSYILAIFCFIEYVLSFITIYKLFLMLLFCVNSALLCKIHDYANIFLMLNYT